MHTHAGVPTSVHVVVRAHAHAGVRVPAGTAQLCELGPGGLQVAVHLFQNQQLKKQLCILRVSGEAVPVLVPTCVHTVPQLLWT